VLDLITETNPSPGRTSDLVSENPFLSNEKEISHGRVCHGKVAGFTSIGAAAFIDWLLGIDNA